MQLIFLSFISCLVCYVPVLSRDTSICVSVCVSKQWSHFLVVTLYSRRDTSICLSVCVSNQWSHFLVVTLYYQSYRRQGHKLCIYCFRAREATLSTSYVDLIADLCNQVNLNFLYCCNGKYILPKDINMFLLRQLPIKWQEIIFPLCKFSKYKDNGTLSLELIK